MAHCSRYALLSLNARPPRDERLNVGIVVLEDTGLQVFLPRSLKKVQALSAALDEGVIRQAAEGLAEVDAYVRTISSSEYERLSRLSEYSPFAVTAGGSLWYHSQASFDHEIAGLIDRLVVPEPAPAKRREKSSPLLTMVKKVFREHGVLASRGDDLSAHRIVPSVQFAEGFSADLLLQNGAMHVVETVDASQPDIAVRRVIADVAVSALTIERAKIVFGEEETNGRIVYNASASVEAAASIALDTAAHQGIELVNWSSADDRRRFVATLSGLATPKETKGARNRLRIHASSQPKFSLN